MRVCIYIYKVVSLAEEPGPSSIRFLRLPRRRRAVSGQDSAPHV